MFCLQCRTEYRQGFTRCSDCNSELVNQLRPDPSTRAGLPDSELIAVQVFSSQIDAELAKSALEAAGIESMLQSRDGPLLSGAWGGTQFAPSLPHGIDLLVRSEDLDRSREILTTEPIPEE